MNRLTFHSVVRPSQPAVWITSLVFVWAGSATGADWQSLGPTPITTGPYAGRVSALAVSPTDADRYFAAGADGGVWRTSDGGTIWTPLTDHLPRCAIGALVLDPQNENIIYAGSGEANYANHSRYGVGLYKSVDGGDTWEVLAGDVFGGRSFSRIVIDPTNSDVVYAAITPAGGFPEKNAARGHPLADGPLGVFKSVDGGISWTHLLNGLPSLAATDLAIDHTDPQVLYAGIGRIFGDPANGVYKSTDGGDSWSKLAGGLPSSDVGRVSLAVAPSDTSRLYTIITETSDDFGGGAATLDVYRSDNAGLSWVPTNSGNFQASYGWYLSVVLVKSDNPDVVFVGGLTMLRSINAGDSWSDVTPPHVDVHALAYDASERLLVGDDGGVHRSANHGNSWTSLNDTLSTIQFYAGISLNRDDPNFVLGGFQDNGTCRREGDTSSWTQRIGGDGGWTSNHPDEPGRYFGEFQGTSNLYRSVNTGDNFSWIGSGISSSDRNCFLPPHVIDPADPDRIYFATHRIWLSTVGGGSWTAISGDLTGGSPAAIRSLAIAPSNGQVLYAATNDGRVLVSDNGGVDWDLTLTHMPGWIRVTKELAVDPLNDAEAYLAVSWYGTDKILRTTDRGQEWTPIGHGLPDVPVNTVAVHRIGTHRDMFIGTDEGVYRSIDSGDSWVMYGASLPHAPIVDLTIDDDNHRLVAATEGRGAWQIDLPPLDDSDEDGDVDLVDFGAFSACFSGPGIPQLDPTCPVFDFEMDGDIDLHDFAIFMQVFSGA